MNKQYGMPPVYFLPFYTADRGKTWQLVPVPVVQTASSLTEGRFGGFWTDGKAVQALYFGEIGGSNQASSLLVKQTIDGGLSWEPASLTCPSSGPCLRWGAAPGEVSGMGADLLQDVIASFDQGRTWSSTGETVDVRLPGPHELVALSQDEALIISGNARYPLRYTSDGGRTWKPVSGLTTRRALGLTQDPRDPRVLFAGTEGGLYRSDVDGTMWTRIGLSGKNIATIAISRSGSSTTPNCGASSAHDEQLPERKTR